MLRALSITLIAAALSACGIQRLHEIRAMSPEQLAALSDQEICEEVNRQAVLSPPVDVKLMREAQKRNLEYCMTTDRNK